MTGNVSAGGNKQDGRMPTTIWLVNSHQWPRAALRAELLERGYEVTGFPNLALAARQLLQVDARPPAVLIIELEALDPAEPSVIRAIASCGASVLLLRGALVRHNDLAAFFSNASVIQRPYTLGDVANWVDDVVKP